MQVDIRKFIERSEKIKPKLEVLRKELVAAILVDDKDKSYAILYEMNTLRSVKSDPRLLKRKGIKGLGKKKTRGHKKTKSLKKVVLPSDFYISREWRELRYKALKKNNGCCVLCGRSRKKDNVILHVDHIKPKSKFPELALSLNNLQILCEDCNLGKSNYDSTDWR